MIEFFDHTADLGIRVTAANLAELFCEAARGLTAALVENPDAVEPRQRVAVNLEGDDRTFLFFDWLREWLYRFDTEQFLGRRFEVNVDERGLHGEAWGEPLDRDRHVPAHEVKAVTYHQLKLESGPKGWLAEFIVDI